MKKLLSLFLFLSLSFPVPLSAQMGSSLPTALKDLNLKNPTDTAQACNQLLRRATGFADVDVTIFKDGTGQVIIHASAENARDLLNRLIPEEYWDQGLVNVDVASTRERILSAIRQPWVRPAGFISLVLTLMNSSFEGSPGMQSLTAVLATGAGLFTLFKSAKSLFFRSKKHLNTILEKPLDSDLQVLITHSSNRWIYASLLKKRGFRKVQSSTERVSVKPKKEKKQKEPKKIEPNPEQTKKTETTEPGPTPTPSGAEAPKPASPTPAPNQAPPRSPERQPSQQRVTPQEGAANPGRERDWKQADRRP